MKKFHGIKIAFALFALAFGSNSWGQSVFLKYGPQPGIQKSTGLDYHNTAAVASDVIGLWSGCSATNFLQGNGTCAQVNLGTEVTGTLPVGNGGTGVGTLTNHGVLLGAATGNVTAVAAMAADTLLQGQGVTASPAAVAVNNCGSGTQALSYSTSTHTFGCQTISSGGTGTVTSVGSGTGVTASPNPIIATGTLAIDQAFSPTWTGTHTYSFPPNFNGGFSGSVVSTTVFTGTLANTSTGTAASTEYRLSNGTNTFVMGLSSTGFSGVEFGGGPTGQQMYIGSGANLPLTLGANGNAQLSLQSGGQFGRGPVAAALVDMTPDTGTFTLTYTGYASPPSCTATWARMGKVVVFSFCVAAATSNAGTLTATGIPASIRPVTTQFVGPSCPSITDNGAGLTGTCAISVNSSGVATFFLVGNPSGWTATGSKGVNSVTTVTWQIN